MTARSPISIGITTLAAAPTVDLAALSLSDVERTRAAAFHAAADRDRFLLGRWLVRELTSERTGLAPADVDFHHDAAGRPTLRGAAGAWFISLAHSGNLVIASIADVPVGVDVEELPDRPLHDRMEARVCSAPELGLLTRLRGADRQLAFMAIWARKEAYGKALGVGLDFPQRSVTVVPGSRVLGVADRFWVADLDVGPGYASAICAAGRARQVEVRQYPTSGR